MRRSAVIALLFAAVVATGAGAQRAPKIDVVVTPNVALAEGPVVSSSGLLADPTTRDFLLHSLPVHIHYRLELWRKALLNDRVGVSEWDVEVAYQPATQLYTVVQHSSDNRVVENFGGFTTLTAAELQMAKPVKTALHPSAAGRYYYRLTVEVSLLTKSDVDGLQQWLHGGSFSSTVGALLSRVLGGGKTPYYAESGVFTAETRPPN